MPVLARAASKDAVNCPARSRTRNRKLAAWSPRSIRRLRICWVVHGPSGLAVIGDVHVAAAGLDDEQAVPALEGNGAVHVDEAGGKHGRGLRVQELPPALIGVPFRSRGDLQ